MYWGREEACTLIESELGLHESSFSDSFTFFQERNNRLAVGAEGKLLFAIHSCKERWF